MLDQLMTTLRHATAGRQFAAVSQIRGRLRALQRRVSLLRDGFTARLRTTPLMSEDEIYAAVRGTQLQAIHVVLGKLYEQMHSGIQYRGLFGADLITSGGGFLRNRPNMERSAGPSTKWRM